MKKNIVLVMVVLLLVGLMVGVVVAKEKASAASCPMSQGSGCDMMSASKSAHGGCPMMATSTRPAKGAKSAVCPVMGTAIPDIKNAAGKSVYKGKTYYFCCKGCKPQFDKSPEKYVKALAAKEAAAKKQAAAKPAKVTSAVCPVMGSKIADVSKASGKSVYKGKTYYFCCGGCKPQFDKNPEKYVR